MLPANFIFSQSNLQNYVDCKQRFYLEHIIHLEWPANQSEPVLLQEERMAIGSEFHLLCNQFFCGIPAEAIRESISNVQLLQWWDSFLALGLTPGPNAFSEKTITIPFHGYRLIAKYDLLVREERNKYTIFDWKTNAKRPSLSSVQNKMQSIVYPVALWSFLKLLPGDEDQNFNIEMSYWYPEFPDQPHRFHSSLELIKHQETELLELIYKISETPPDGFFLTDEVKKCAYCHYRSYCNRGQNAGKFDEERFTEE
jgi:hypothetical protein